MRQDVKQLSERMLDFAVAVIEVVGLLRGSAPARHVGGQLLRSGTSAAANYEEACAAESRADFLHKLQVVLKELRESHFWLRLALRARLAPEPSVAPVLNEANQLCAIMTKSVITAKQTQAGDA